MKASEILYDQEPPEVESPISIDESTEEFGWNRRSKLTLRTLHRLRLMQELKSLEAAEKRKFVSDMYGDQFEESDEKEKDSRTPPKTVKPPNPFKPLKPSSQYLDKHTRK